MFLKKGVSALLLVYSGITAAYGQRLKPGDRLPDLIINHIIRYPGGTVNTADFKGKLLLLDFMNTYCGNCIEALPLLDSLQQQFGDKIRVLVVSNEPAPRIKQFLSVNKIAGATTLPFVTADTQLSRLFPHVYFPHEAWIMNDTVRAITEASYITRQNISEVLTDGEVNWPVKTDSASFDYHKPLFTDMAGPYYSAVRAAIAGVAARKVTDTGKVLRLRFINYSILELYRYCLCDSTPLPYSHDRLLTSRASELIYRNNPQHRDSWNLAHSWCYEIAFPKTMPLPAVKFQMKNDLDRYFHLHGVADTANVLCYELVRADSSGTAAGDLDFLTLDDLLKRLNHDFLGIPFESSLDQRSITNLRIERTAMGSISALETALHAMGLELVPKTERVPVLEIRDN